MYIPSISLLTTILKSSILKMVNNKSAQKGLAPLVIIAIVGVIIAGVIIVFKGNSTSKKTTPSVQQQTKQESSSSGSMSDALEWETFKNSEMGYSIKHPKGWVAKDESGKTNRKLTVSHPKNFANVLIVAHKDDSLKETGGMAKAIKGRKEFLESDKELKIADFKDTVEEKKGGWLMVGEKTIDGKKWQLEERGLLDIYGKVLLMQSGYSDDYGKQYKDTVRQIMDSFSVE
jgi:hypothetical protein